MGIYHITYVPELNKVCLYFDGKCNFSCKGCITDFYPLDYHLDKKFGQIKNKPLSIDEVRWYLKPLSIKKVIFLGKEPTCDKDFLPLARYLKEKFYAYHILLTNGYRYIGGKIKNRVIDEICISIKAVSKKIFQDFTGKSNPQQVLTNFKRYVNNPWLKVRAESVFIPGYIDEEEIEKIVRFIASIDKTIHYRIDGYIPSSTLDNLRRPTEAEMEEVKKIAQRYLKNVSILHSGIKPKFKVKRIY